MRSIYQASNKWFNNIITVFFCCVLFQTTPLFGQNSFSVSSDRLKFVLSYQTIRPIETKRAIFYYSIQKNSHKRDSIVLNYTAVNEAIDTIVISSRWNFPLYVKLKLEGNDLTRVSNEFYYFPGTNFWDVSVGDSTLQVKSKLVHNFANPYKPLVGLILIIQTILEMILAFMMSQMVGWSRMIWVMVLTANIASFPLYLINFNFIWLRELVVLGTKTFVMSLIGYRKIHLYKIIIFAIVLSIVSFGFKEILFVIMRII